MSFVGFSKGGFDVRGKRCGKKTLILVAPLVNISEIPGK